MWQRIRRELLIEYYWWKRHSVKKWRMDSPSGIMGILFISSGIILMIIIGQAFAFIFRSMVPMVSGYQAAGVYWSSVVIALKFSIGLIIFFSLIILFIFIKFFKRR